MDCDEKHYPNQEASLHVLVNNVISPGEIVHLVRAPSSQGIALVFPDAIDDIFADSVPAIDNALLPLTLDVGRRGTASATPRFMELQIELLADLLILLMFLLMLITDSD